MLSVLMRSIALAVFLLISSLAAEAQSWDYCIVGAGPGGLQLARELHTARRNYVVFERAAASGSFFERYPRHRQLNSLNRGDVDQHSLNGRPSVHFRDYSKEAYPQADAYAAYLRAFSTDLNIKYNSDCTLSRPKDSKTGGARYLVTVNNSVHQCSVAIVATGLGSARTAPRMQGLEHLETYESMPTDPSNYTNQSVILMGAGNSAFETAQALADTAAQVWVVGRHRIRLAMETRYSGDVRATSNHLLDSYQLKSLDALTEHTFTSKNSAILRDASSGELKIMEPNLALKYPTLRADIDRNIAKGVKGMKKFVDLHPNIGPKYIELQATKAQSGGRDWEQLYGNIEGDNGGWSAELWRSNRIITCWGFKFNQTLFTGAPEACSRKPCGPVPLSALIELQFRKGQVEETLPFDKQQGEEELDGKPVSVGDYPLYSYPLLNGSYGSDKHPNLYFAGELMHGADYRRGNGHMVHGFRHSVSALAHWLAFSRHQTPWPAVKPRHDGTSEFRLSSSVAAAVLKAAVPGSAAHSMHGELVEVFLLPATKDSMLHVQAVPRRLLDMVLPEHHIQIQLEWGWGFDRSAGDFLSPRAVSRRTELGTKIAKLDENIHEQHLIGRAGAVRGSAEDGPMADAAVKVLQGEKKMLEYERDMLNTNSNLFLPERHPRESSRAAAGFMLHPVVSWSCPGVQPAAPKHHMLEAIDGEFNHMKHHVLPLLEYLTNAMDRCSK